VKAVRVYVTGADGLVGTALMTALAAGSTATWSVLGVTASDFDIADRPAVLDSIAAFAPDVVVHCAANAVVDDCEQRPGAALQVNVGGVRNVADGSVLSRSRMIYLSSDYVFDGARPPTGGYREGDGANPLSVYGVTKLAGEQLVSRVPDHLVVRTSWLFGGADASTDPLLLTLRAAERGLRTPLVCDQCSSPTYSADLARALVSLLVHPVNGVLHVANTGSASWYDVGTYLLRELSLQPQPLPMHACGFVGARPADSTLNTDRLAVLGLGLPPWTDAVDRYRAALTDRAAV